MTCFPPCSDWCVCVNDTCQPSPIAINAVRFLSTNSRFLHALNGGGAAMVAASTGLLAGADTFLLRSPASWPLTSGSPLSLEVCNGTFGPSGFRVLVDHNVKFLGRSKGLPLVTYEVGGPGAAVWVTTGLPAGYPAYSGDDPAERIFDIVKMVGNNPVFGSPISNGDHVCLRITSNLGSTFFFRVTGSQDGAEVDGTGRRPGNRARSSPRSSTRCAAGSAGGRNSSTAGLAPR
jgi:hypothetical protein